MIIGNVIKMKQGYKFLIVFGIPLNLALYMCYLQSGSLIEWLKMLGIISLLVIGILLFFRGLLWIYESD